MVYATIAWALASVGSFGVLVLLANVALLVGYLLCCLAAIELRRRGVQAAGRPFEVPVGGQVNGADPGRIEYGPGAACAGIA